MTLRSRLATTARQRCARVLKQDGLPGLYRGVFARVAWLAPSAGIMITVFEFVHAQ